MIRLYDFLPSGNGYKVRLLLHQLGIPFELVEVDILKGETRTPAFLEKNPNGRIPVVRLDDGSHLAESNAILVHFAEGTRFFPEDRLERARCLQWLFFEQYSHEPNVATVRFWAHYVPELDDWQRATIERKRALGVQALGVMERHLAARRWLVGERYGVADIALYAYTHVAGEGGFDLGPFPAVREWLDRVAAEPRHVRITDRPPYESALVGAPALGHGPELARRETNMGDFLTDVKELRRRARQHVENGAVTAGYMADRETVIRLLNEALATEIVCVLRYKRHYFMAQGIHAEPVAAEFLQHANEEQGHADEIAARIVQLGGAPNLSPEGMLTRSHSEYVEGETLGEMIRENLVAERVAIDSYAEMIRYIGDKDLTTRRMLEGILAVEEEHADDLASMLQTVEPKPAR